MAKRKQTASASSSSTNTSNKNIKKQKQSSSSTASSSKKMFKKKKNGVAEMFQTLAENPNDPNSLINMEGIAQLGERLGIDATEDIRILVLLWKLHVKEKPGCIFASEWTSGCEHLGVTDWDGFRAMIPSLDTGFLETNEFKDFYKFCFKFNLSGTHKTLDKDLVVALIPMVLKDRVPQDRLETFIQFLEQTTSPYKQITMDQWVNFLDFTYEVPDLDQYDETNSAWPVMLDEYVEYMQKLQQQQQQTTSS